MIPALCPRYVDDIVIMNDEVAIDDLKRYLHANLDIKDPGLLNFFLGIEVARSSRGLVLSQRKYALNLFMMLGCLLANRLLLRWNNI